MRTAIFSVPAVFLSPNSRPGRRDEPEAALSPHRLLSLLVAIDDLVKNDSQFLIATHSPILMSYPKAEVLELSVDGIRTVSYKETEHYKLTKQFIDAPEQMLKYLLNG